jgi:hypothetical protein
MSRSASRFATKTCGALSCHKDAEVVIDHPEHGERTVCADHAEGYEVVRHV